jgi:hypothetical protein
MLRPSFFVFLTDLVKAEQSDSMFVSCKLHHADKVATWKNLCL